MSTHPTLKCRVCLETKTSPGLLWQHFQVKHPTHSRDCPQQKCPKHFYCKDLLKRHFFEQHQLPKLYTIGLNSQMLINCTYCEEYIDCDQKSVIDHLCKHLRNCEIVSCPINFCLEGVYQLETAFRAHIERQHPSWQNLSLADFFLEDIKIKEAPKPSQTASGPRNLTKVGGCNEERKYTCQYGDKVSVTDMPGLSLSDDEMCMEWNVTPPASHIEVPKPIPSTSTGITESAVPSSQTAAAFSSKLQLTQSEIRGSLTSGKEEDESLFRQTTFQSMLRQFRKVAYVAITQLIMSHRDACNVVEFEYKFMQDILAQRLNSTREKIFDILNRERDDRLDCAREAVNEFCEKPRTMHELVLTKVKAIVLQELKDKDFVNKTKAFLDATKDLAEETS